MDRLQAMEVFTRVVETSSFSKTADLLQLPRASVSNIIQALELYVGVRLLNRTTRRVSVTEDGALYYDRCVRILDEITDAESTLASKRRDPVGVVRVDTSGSFGKLMLPALPDFYARYPGIELRIGLADRMIDLIQDGVDCVIRLGALEDSSLIVRKIGSARVTTCAAPSYLQQYGVPATLEELRGHRAVNYFSARSGKQLSFTFELEGGETASVPLPGIVAVNDGDAYVNAGVIGLGIIQPPRFMAAPFIDEGALTEILTKERSPPTPLSILYPPTRNIASRVRVFSDWVAELCARNPDLRIP
jgi:LysR family transcriptional regulator, regulator for bpeEF and oprC